MESVPFMHGRDWLTSTTEQCVLGAPVHMQEWLAASAALQNCFSTFWSVHTVQHTSHDPLYEVHTVGSSAAATVRLVLLWCSGYSGDSVVVQL